MGFSFKKPEDSPGFLLWQLTNEWQRKQRRALTKLGLTHAQFVVLACLLWLSKHSTGPVTQNQISTLANIDKMMVSDLVNTLIRKKLLIRSPHGSDNRAYDLSLTATGCKLIVKAIPLVENIDAEFFTKETRNLVQLHNILKQRLAK
jgi:DNA-binding MarR family transcriptional regulator